MIRGYCAAQLLFWLANAQLTSPPDFADFPQPIIFLALGLAGGTVLTSAAALLREALACVGTYEAVSRGSATDVREPAETARRAISVCQTPQRRYQQLRLICRHVAAGPVLLRA